ncbi:hypothetical protein [Streptomyces fructofermentans]|uniref:Uncharacterized protein n=1 Tax=Streptomyces fructofermentans TaxID=152141 RepID=A0A918KNA7_9ACTN|nr:hypothetical protein [Streptomyces fructofermentans]GGX70147.1 hypothetical protein GCM10010515_42280 [Streptomyces fructofermentans]
MAGSTGTSTCGALTGKELAVGPSGDHRSGTALAASRPPVRTAGLAQPSEAAGDGPVFVDTTGRRRRWLRTLGWVVAFSCVGFAATVTAVLALGNAAAPWISLPGGDKKARTSREVPAVTDLPAPTVGPSPGAQRVDPVSPSGARNLTVDGGEPSRNVSEASATPSGTPGSGRPRTPAETTPASKGTEGGTPATTSPGTATATPSPSSTPGGDGSDEDGEGGGAVEGGSGGGDATASPTPGAGGDAIVAGGPSDTLLRGLSLLTPAL